MKMNINVFFMCVFIAMLFYGIVTLLPSRSASRKKQKRNPSQVIDATVGIILGTSGLLLMIFAFVIQNPTAQTIYTQFRKYWMIAGLLIWGIDILIKIVNKGKKSEKSKKTILVGDIEVIYGITTPQVFNGSAYRVAYETMVREPKIPFITCELQMAQDSQYIGDIIFGLNEFSISEEDLRSMPISEIHLDR